MKSALCLLAAFLSVTTPLPAQERQERFHLNEGGENQVGYTQAVRVGNTLYISGSVGRGATMEAQMESAYANIQRTLEHYGASMADVVRETVYTRDMEALQRAIPVRKRIYGERFPAATWVQVTRLFAESILLEIETTAVIGSAPAPGTPNQ
jgi:2-iminobutanoate/2-iminopropanoate deaminase